MDILITDSWLRKYLETNAKPNDIARCLSLCGPSIERVKKIDSDYLYEIEVTSNRVDCACVVGIAREASVILPQFGFKAKFIKDGLSTEIKYKLVDKVSFLSAVVDKKLCSRFTAALIENVQVGESSKEIKDKLEKIGVRSVNNIVDISNLVMYETGQPVHTFDYDKIIGKKMILRQSKKGEIVITLDDKKFILDGQDIVIEDGSNKIIDLCGIMGGGNSQIDSDTKNVLLFIQTYNKDNIRKTSMRLGQRTQAAILFEKGLDSQNVINGLNLSLELFGKLNSVKINPNILDIKTQTDRQNIVKTNINKINSIIGVEIKTDKIIKILESLGFKVIVKSGGVLEVEVPSFRNEDIQIPEDIAEEVARIYGYHNLNSSIMAGILPPKTDTSAFRMEKEIRQFLKSNSYNEVYNLSLISKDWVDLKHAVLIKNPLGLDTQYLRTSLRPGLVESINQNIFVNQTLKMFEMSNIYINKKGDLPYEKMILAGIVKNQDFVKSKSDVLYMLKDLKIDFQEQIVDKYGYLPGQAVEIRSGKNTVGWYGNLENGLFYFEFEMEKLLSAKPVNTKYQPVSKFPPQIEDLTFEIASETYIGKVIDEIYATSKLITKVKMVSQYNQKFTFNIEYQSSKETLSNRDVEKVRSKIVSNLNKKFGASLN